MLQQNTERNDFYLSDKPHLSCRWSKYFVIVGLPTNNLVVAEGQGISGLEAEFNEH